MFLRWNQRIRYVEKKTRGFAVLAARIAGFPTTTIAGLAAIGFIFDSFRSSSSTLRCSCRWGRLVCVIVPIVSRSEGGEKDAKRTVCKASSVEILKHSSNNTDGAGHQGMQICMP